MGEPAPIAQAAEDIRLVHRAAAAVQFALPIHDKEKPSAQSGKHCEKALS
jgi:hypothetical protein